VVSFDEVSIIASRASRAVVTTASDAARVAFHMFNPGVTKRRLFSKPNSVQKMSLLPPQNASNAR
jgi:hypothetical protein